MKKRILSVTVMVLALGALAMPLLAQALDGAPEATSKAANAAANAASPAPTTTAPAGGRDGGGLFGGGNSMPIFIVLIAVMFLLMWWSGRSRRKQEAKHKEMLANLKKGDKVTSIGGIRGTVIETREDEVLVKVDETNNIRMRFARWAIRNVGEEAKDQQTQQQPPQENK